MVLLPITAGVLRWQQIRSALNSTGGQGNWSDAIYPLSDFLQNQRADRKVVAADWGIWHPVVCLSDGKVKITERSYRSSVMEFEKLLDDPNVCFCYHWPDWTRFPAAREQLLQAAVNRHCTLEVVKTFSDRTGNPVLIVAERH